MLMNIAEDLKEYAKIKVSAMQETEGAEETKPVETKSGSKKPSSIEDI